MGISSSQGESEGSASTITRIITDHGGDYAVPNIA